MKEENVKEKKMLTLTGMVNFLNENFKKQSGTKFTTSDVQSYIRRGYLPKYLGDYSIHRDKKMTNLKIYNIKKDE